MEYWSSSSHIKIVQFQLNITSLHSSEIQEYFCLKSNVLYYSLIQAVQSTLALCNVHEKSSSSLAQCNFHKCTVHISSALYTFAGVYICSSLVIRVMFIHHWRCKICRQFIHHFIYIYI